MGERKDLRDLLRDTDFTQKRIIDDLANSDVEANYGDKEVSQDIKRSEGGDIIKNIVVGLLLIGIVIGSFWISFLIGKKVLVPPVKNLATIEIPMPKTVSPAEIEKAVPVQEEPELKEREIKPEEIKPKPVKQTVVKAPVATTKGTKYYKVIVGAYKTSSDANAMVASLNVKGFASYVKKISGLFRVQAGAFDVKSKALPLVAKLKDKGFNPTIIVE